MNSNDQTLFKAIEFANWAHRKQKRKIGDAPYIVHPFHVMTLLMAHVEWDYDSRGLTLLVAGVLHDTVEDNREEVTLDLIAQKFGAEVARVVAGVTLDPKNPDKRASRQKILKSDWMIRILKITDILSNTMATIDPIKQLGFKEVQKYFGAPLSERIQMEEEFLKAVQIDGDPLCLGRILGLAQTALAELKAIAK